MGSMLEGERMHGGRWQRLSKRAWGVSGERENTQRLWSGCTSVSVGFFYLWDAVRAHHVVTDAHLRTGARDELIELSRLDTMSAQPEIAASSILAYLGLPESYEPSPQAAPVEFLRKHVRELPPHMLKLFSSTTTPRERTAVPVIRNRRLKYTDSKPAELSLVNAKSTWPALWEGWERPGKEQARDEKDWAEKEFMGGGSKQQVGKLGALLADYEEERESERVRSVRRQRAEYIESLPEEDDESDESDEDLPTPQETSPVENEAMFLRIVKERFIYGFLEVHTYIILACGLLLIISSGYQSIDYDKVDWDERWDGDLDRDAEERWFDDEEED